LLKIISFAKYFINRYMFFFGFASNIITLIILGVVSMLFLYQGVSDAALQFFKKNVPDQVVIQLEDATNSSDETTIDYYIAILPDETTLRINPSFVHFDYPKFAEKIPIQPGFLIYSRGPPSM